MITKNYEYEERRTAAGRAYGNQFATGRYRVKLIDSEGSFTFAFRSPRTAQRFMRRRTRKGTYSGVMYRLDENGQRQEFRRAAQFAASFGDYSTTATVMIADMICH